MQLPNNAFIHNGNKCRNRLLLVHVKFVTYRNISNKQKWFKHKQNTSIIWTVYVIMLMAAILYVYTTKEHCFLFQWRHIWKFYLCFLKKWCFSYCSWNSRNGNCCEKFHFIFYDTPSLRCHTLWNLLPNYIFHVIHRTCSTTYFPHSILSFLLCNKM